jgi:SAM-dependent methyltransferase
MDQTQKKLAQYFTKKLEEFGPTPKGVDYNSPQAQEVRFQQLTKLIEPSYRFTIIDYGCGYGALFDFLKNRGWNFEYFGVDLIEKMVITARQVHELDFNTHFTTIDSDLPIVDYLIAGAIFNIKMDAAYNEWREMVAQTLIRMDRLCTRGFAFNMLTSYSDPNRMEQRPDLFFADPLFFFDFCKRAFSRNVALLHDYGIYDFTILVRKDL